MRRLVTLGSAQWWYLAASLAGAVLMYFIIVAIPEWQHVYTVEVRGPQLQRCLGFTASRPTPSRMLERGTMLTISSVEPDSPLGRAGIRPGDIPVGYKHGMETGFYADLEAVVDGRSVTLTIVAREDFERGSEAWRQVRVEGRRVACPIAVRLDDNLRLQSIAVDFGE